jgi:hypothetical protein
MGCLPANPGSQENRPGAGPPDLHALSVFAADRLVDPKDSEQPGHAGALAARKDQAFETGEVFGAFDGKASDAESLQVIQVFEDAPLQIQDAQDRLRPG